MSSKLLLRLAAVMMFLHTIGHSIGALTWKTPPNPAVGQVIRGMEDNHFDFMGRTVTLAAFFDGYGFTMMLVLLSISFILWFISGEGKSRLTVKLTTVLAIFLLGMAIIEFVYFFPLPAVLSSIAGFCTLAGRLRLKSI